MADLAVIYNNKKLEYLATNQFTVCGIVIEVCKKNYTEEDMNNKYFFQNDDLGPFQPSSADIVLRQQLEKSLSKFFYDNCDRKIRDLLSVCRWYVTTQTSAMVLVIECPDQVTNWRVLQRMVPMASLLNNIASSAKIRICPPVNQGIPFEMRVDELSVYREDSA
ncbi:hypothetical protein [Plectonema radiosum]|nr:hypothetical protein [Plectonema radiosum]